MVGRLSRRGRVSGWKLSSLSSTHSPSSSPSSTQQEGEGRVSGWKTSRRERKEGEWVED